MLDELQDERGLARAWQTGDGDAAGRSDQRVVDASDQPLASHVQRVGLLLRHLEEQRLEYELLLLPLLVRRRTVLGESH